MTEADNSRLSDRSSVESNAPVALILPPAPIGGRAVGLLPPAFGSGRPLSRLVWRNARPEPIRRAALARDGPRNDWHTPRSIRLQRRESGRSSKPTKGSERAT